MFGTGDCYKVIGKGMIGRSDTYILFGKELLTGCLAQGINTNI
jgi:hypothetical protein